MPKRKPCPKGRACKFQDEHQHTSEYDHGDASDVLAAKTKKRKEDDDQEK
jgi:hypothetical protein